MPDHQILVPIGVSTQAQPQPTHVCNSQWRQHVNTYPPSPVSPSQNPPNPLAEERYWLQSISQRFTDYHTERNYLIAQDEYRQGIINDQNKIISDIQERAKEREAEIKQLNDAQSVAHAQQIVDIKRDHAYHLSQAVRAAREEAEKTHKQELKEFEAKARQQSKEHLGEINKLGQIHDVQLNNLRESHASELARAEQDAAAKNQQDLAELDRNVEEANAEHETKVNSLDAQIRSLQTELTNTKAISAKARERRIKKLEQLICADLDTYENLDSQKTALDARLVDVEQENKALKSAKENLEAGLTWCDQEMAILQVQKAHSDTQVKMFQHLFKAAQLQLDGVGSCKSKGCRKVGEELSTTKQLLEELELKNELWSKQLDNVKLEHKQEVASLSRENKQQLEAAEQKNATLSEQLENANLQHIQEVASFKEEMKQQLEESELKSASLSKQLENANLQHIQEVASFKEEMKQQLEAAEQEIVSLSKNRQEVEDLEKKRSELLEKLQAAQNYATEMEDKYKVEKAHGKKVEDKRDQEQNQVKYLTKKNGETQAKLKTHKQDTEAAKKELGEVRETLSATRKALHDAQASHENSRKEIDQAGITNMEHFEARKKAEAIAIEAERKAAEGAAKIAKLESKVATLQKQPEALLADLEKTRKLLKACGENLTKSNLRVKELEDKERGSRETLEEWRRKVDTSEARIDELEAEVRQYIEEEKDSKSIIDGLQKHHQDGLDQLELLKKRGTPGTLNNPVTKRPHDSDDGRPSPSKKARMDSDSSGGASRPMHDRGTAYHAPTGPRDGRRGPRGPRGPWSR